MITESKNGTPRTKAICEAINAALKPYSEQYFSTATAMLLIGQFLEIGKLEKELNQANNLNIGLLASQERLKGLRDLMGYIQAGEGVTVKLFQDDATGAYFVTSGDKSYYADGFNQAIDKAIAAQEKP